MRKPCVEDIVFRKISPHPKPNDPVTFAGHVQRNLVPEVRLEVQTFYGSLDCLEAQYPGLDYTFGPHRRRLARYPWHRRLFRVFDELRLTDHEILSLCRWEGTRSAKERYEFETKRAIRDTTADDVAKAEEGYGPRGRVYQWHDPPHRSPSLETLAQAGAMDMGQPEEDSDEDEISASIGVQLNQQLQAAVEARSRGEAATVDAQWEQWMKEMLERDEFSRDGLLRAIRSGQAFPTSTASGSRLGTSMMLEADTTASGRSSNTGPAAASAIPTHASANGDIRSALRDLHRSNSQLARDNATLAMMIEARSQPESARS